VLLLVASPALAAPIVVTVGDNDGFGLGVADNATGIVWPGGGASGTGYDARSLVEATATNGAQITDVDSAIFPSYGPNSATADVVFPFTGTLTSAVLTVDMGDFQATAGGDIAVTFNGIPQPGLFHFDDGYQNSAVRTFALDAVELAAANAAQQFVVSLDHGSSYDFVAFDYFQLNGEVGVIPEPSTLIVWSLLGALGIGLAWWRRRRAA
jgi:hypothetical protein